MVTLVILFVVMTIIAVAACVVPMFTACNAKVDNARIEQNLAILRQQAKELEAEKAAGHIDEDEYEESRLELERRVLEETKSEETASTESKGKFITVLAVIVAIMIPVISGTMYLAFGRYTAADPAFIAAMEEEAARQRGHSASDMRDMLQKLKDQLEIDPSNPQAWFMLARVSASTGRFDDAVEAYKHLVELVPDNSDIIADMADMMAAANGRVITPDIEKLLNKALEINPDQWKALALLAIQAWDRQQYAKAAELWEHCLRVIPPDFPDVDQLKANIAEAKRLGGVNDSISHASPNAKNQNAADSRNKKIPTASPADMKKVSGAVTISDALKSKVGPNDIVFIYARPVDSKMPVALHKVKAKELPYNFTLDETMTMAMGADTLGKYKTVIVGARISKTGNIMPQSGDLEGEMGNPVEVGDTGLIVQINQEHK